MHELDEVIQFIIDALSANASKGHGSVVTIRVAPYSKKGQTKKTKKARAITHDDVLNAHAILESFDGDFKKLFGTRQS